MTTSEGRGPNVSLAEFEAIFESVKNWGRWGPDDVLGTLNYITPEHVAARPRSCAPAGTVSMAIPINTVAGPDNPNPAIHHMTQMHDSTSARASCASRWTSSAWSSTATATRTSTRCATSPTTG